MKFKIKSFVSCSLVMGLSITSAFAQQQQAGQAPNPLASIQARAAANMVQPNPQTGQLPTNQQNNEATGAAVSNMLGNNFQNDPTLLDKPIRITVRVGARTDQYYFHSDTGIFERQSNGSNSSMSLSAAVPVLKECGAAVGFKGAHPDLTSELALVNGELDDTITLNDDNRTQFVAPLERGKGETMTFTYGAQLSLEQAETSAILNGLSDAVGDYNNTLAPLGYQVDLRDAVIVDSRSPNAQTDQNESDPNDPCKDFLSQQKSLENQKADPNIDRFGSLKMSKSSFWYLSYNPYTITISIKPKKL